MDDDNGGGFYVYDHFFLINTVTNPVRVWKFNQLVYKQGLGISM